LTSRTDRSFVAGITQTRALSATEWRPRALHPSNDGDALMGKRARLAPDAFPSARLLFQFFRPATLKAVDYVAWQFC
jgi:hypothetical protein